MGRNFFQGMYGWDSLSAFLLLISLPLLLSKYTLLIGLAGMSFALWRMVSKTREDRKREEIAFRTALRKLIFRFYYLKQNRIFSGLKERWRERRDFAFFSCPNCKQKLRVPRHKGMIMVTCRKCSHKFKKKT